VDRNSLLNKIQSVQTVASLSRLVVVLTRCADCTVGASDAATHESTFRTACVLWRRQEFYSGGHTLLDLPPISYAWVL